MLKTNLRVFRARYDMKQDELASRVGVRRETIGHLERGNYNPSLKLAWDIAKVFGVTIEEIFSYEEE
ncbi:helix-turn-helix transcriptional regulator [Macrococcus bovicus]|uniref:Transcriptional regulator n=1 Tax=Macrococcus bovicus TaxID=69968 RepID=A0A4R6C017_9STAP|nr:helix-turn-helix transcriptional regulator [Macrococcus bovicus]TDM14391.1 transcriptional regulator [Macrococcus bovicus]